ncbi:hypothetical protein GUJ93_ZPchr0012g20355 [Zizania palustris]|uniref:Uncharacterized protein n=1 Tax=Zizania palustris TaxID=103762 RepID=A0A8J6BZB1_ZIZPA|nr:hypothetical protein GUJ93_ZPchr0012g20355 [Zizania palustris]
MGALFEGRASLARGRTPPSGCVRGPEDRSPKAFGGCAGGKKGLRFAKQAGGRSHVPKRCEGSDTSTKH